LSCSMQATRAFDSILGVFFALPLVAMS